MIRVRPFTVTLAFALAGAVLSLGAGQATAKSMDSSPCTTPNNHQGLCADVWQWSGSNPVHGAQLYFAPRPYTETIGGGHAGGQFFLALQNYAGTGKINVYVGEDNGRGSAGGSGCSTNQQEYYWEITDQYDVFLAGQCYKIPSGDYSSSTHIQASYFTSNGGGVMIFIQGATVSPCNPCWEHYGGNNNTWQFIKLNTFIDVDQNSNVPTNFMPQQDMVTNKWQCAVGGCAGGWYYQTTAPALVAAYDSPPPVTFFAPDNYGGDLTACASGGSNWNLPCGY